MIPTVAGLLAALQQSALLDAPQLQELQRLAGAHPDPANLSRELVRRGWVTVFQLKQLFLGRGEFLTLGQYVVLDQLGEGGMGLVFKARHRRLDRLDALKVIRQEQVAQADALQRFLREARAAARLNHPNIVTVYDADEAAGTHFIAMEYVAGIDLSRIVREVGPLNAGQACDYVQQAARGLQHAHERGLVHRDIKPSNLLVTADASTVKVLDMGLARLHSHDDADSRSALTQTGVVMGTPDYMAPEQAIDSSKVDIRADIYSLGCTLYYLLTGSPPFPQGSLTQKLLWHQQRDPEPLEGRRPDLPAELVAVVRRMMAKKPEDRPVTPADAARALEPFITLDLPAPEGQLSGQTLAPGELRSSASNDGGFSLAQLSRSIHPKPEDMDFSFCRSSAGLVASLSLPSAASAPTDSSLPAAVSGTDATAILPPSVAPTPPTGPARKDDPTEVLPGKKRKKRRRKSTEEGDAEPEGINWYTVIGIVGFLIAAVAILWPYLMRWFTPGGTGGDSVVRLKEATLVTHDGPVWSGAFLPGGQRAVTPADRKLLLWDTTSGTVVRRLENFTTEVRAVGCSSRKDLVLAGSVETRGGQTKTLRNWDLANQADNVAYESTATLTTLAVSPDGKQVVAAGGVSGGTDFSFGLWDIESGARLQTFTFHKDVVLRVAFSPDGKRIASCSRDSTIAVWSVDAPRPTLTQKLEHRILAVAFTGDGNELILGGENNTLGVYNLGRRDWADLTGFQGHTVDITCVAVSSDGTRLLSGSGDKTVRLWDIAARKPLAILEGHTDLVTSVAFASDGKRALSTSKDRSARVWNLPS